MRAIDLNADLGETVNGEPTADDEAMFAVISSASIACGGHAGDAASMRRACAQARRTGVAIGAHPSYPDRAGFGRAAMAISAVDLHAALSEQLDGLVQAGAEIRYVKPHGALYHAAGRDRQTADALVQAVAELSELLGRVVPILAMGDTMAAATSSAGLPLVHEGFLDRGYQSDGTLVPRGEPGALLHDPERVAARAVGLARDGRVEAVDGTIIEVDVASLCVHGDTPESVSMARAARAALNAAGIPLRAPW